MNKANLYVTFPPKMQLQQDAHDRRKSKRDTGYGIRDDLIKPMVNQHVPQRVSSVMRSEQLTLF